VQYLDGRLSHQGEKEELEMGVRTIYGRSAHSQVDQYRNQSQESSQKKNPHTEGSTRMARLDTMLNISYHDHTKPQENLHRKWRSFDSQEVKV
jgi:hypothetical protein